MTNLPRLMWVTNPRRQSLTTPEIAREVVSAGVDAIHVRERDLPTEQLLKLVADVLNVVGDRAQIIVNTNVTVARELGVGLHLPEALVHTDIDRTGIHLCGRSVHSPSSASASIGCDYVIAGHVYETGSKDGLSPLGLHGLRSIVAASPVPVLAIGGISAERVADVFAAGVTGIAVMSGIGSAEDPQAAARAYRSAIDNVVASQLNKSGGGPIALTVNGKPVEIASSLTIQGFLDSKKLHRTMVVVEHNGTILKRNQFDTIQLASGDVLEVVHFVGGG